VTRLVRALAACALAACALAGGLASAQQPEGRISGVVLLGDSGPVTEPVSVELFQLAGDGLSFLRAMDTDAGRFEFAVEPDIAISYVVRAIYEDQSYLGPPVLLSPELPTAEVEIVVYRATSDAPPLTIERTRVTVLRLDRANALIVFAREDEVRNPSDRLFVGDDEGVTLRIPLPDNTVTAEAGGEGDSRVEGGTLAVATALRPGVTTVVSRYAVGYDRARDAYALRVTAPLPTDHMEVSVPTRFADDIRPLAGSLDAGERDEDGELSTIVVRDGAAGPGESVSVVLDGLAGRNAPNPLTGRRGAAVAVAVALAIIGGGAAALHLAGRRGGATA
jgi:hypothetical protein